MELGVGEFTSSNSASRLSLQKELLLLMASLDELREEIVSYQNLDERKKNSPIDQALAVEISAEISMDIEDLRETLYRLQVHAKKLDYDDNVVALEIPDLNVF